jgi:hypothetical protein
MRIAAAILALPLSLSCAAPALAQQLYAGGGLAYVSGESDYGVPADTADLSAGAGSIILGSRYELANGFWAVEGNADLSLGAGTEAAGGGVCGVSANGPYLCEHKATVRLVGIYGFETASGLEIFGSLGYGIVYGDFADNTASVGSGHVGGATVGIGVSQPMGGGAIRGEIIHDRFTSANQSGGYESDYTATSARVSYIMKF